MRITLIIAAASILSATTAFAQKTDGTTLAGGDNGAKAKASETGKMGMTTGGATTGSAATPAPGSTSSQGTPGPTNPKPGQ